MFKRISVILLAAVVMAFSAGLVRASLAPGQSMAFDFGPADIAPIAGAIRVSHETVYSAGLGYGIFHHNQNFTPNPRSVNRGTVCPYPELTTFVDMTNGQRFQVDVPNDDYYVTAVAGDPTYTYMERFYINETLYGWSFANGVSPAGTPLYLNQHTGWTTDLEMIPIPQSSWRDAGSLNVRVLGYNMQSYIDEDSKHIEFLKLDRALITVTDGQLRFENQWNGGNKFNYIVVERVPEPATMGLLLSGAGLVLFRRRR